MAKWDAHCNSNSATEWQVRLRRCDGVFRWFLFRREPLRDETRSVMRCREPRHLLVSEFLISSAGWFERHVLWVRTRYRIALATSATPRNRRAALSLLGLENSFDFIVDSSRFSKPKPDPEVFKRAILGLGTSAEECLVIEDSLNGILAANAAGCMAAAIPTSFTKQELARSGADFVVDNFEQLRALIETREGG
jgi:FMN phosphatase YigB (HAD superfamily)